MLSSTCGNYNGKYNLLHVQKLLIQLISCKVKLIGMESNTDKDVIMEEDNVPGTDDFLCRDSTLQLANHQPVTDDTGRSEICYLLEDPIGLMLLQSSSCVSKAGLDK